MNNLSEQEIEVQLNEELEKLKKAVFYIETAKETAINAQKVLSDFEPLYNEVKGYKDDLSILFAENCKKNDEIVDYFNKIKIIYDKNEKISNNFEFNLTDLKKNIDEFTHSRNNSEKIIEYYNKNHLNEKNQILNEIEVIKENIEKKGIGFEQKINNLEKLINDIKASYLSELEKFNKENTKKQDNKISIFATIIAFLSLLLAILK